MSVAKHKIYPVLLAGGSGTRLWPTSRSSYPKQFANLLGNYTLFQQAALRVKSSDALALQKPIVVTNNNFRFIVVEQLQSIGVTPGPILIEPEGKNTGPAILAAAEYLRSTEPEALILAMPSDHLMPDALEFAKCVSEGVGAAVRGNIVTFAVEPSRPETGYGYLKCRFVPGNETARVSKFVEKPNAETAESYMSSGDYFWNSGVFLFRASDMHEAISRHCAALVEPVESAVNRGEIDLGFFRLSSDDWSRCPHISIDYAVMEHADNIHAVRFSGDWSDLGGWDAMWEAGQSNCTGVTIDGQVTAVDCSNSLIRSDSPDVHLVGLGLDNIIAVATRDAVLVARKDRAQDVKLVVEDLKRQGIVQATHSGKDHRPWGWFESLALGNRFQVKKIFVNPGAALSLQSHHHRSEHWIVVEGTARVTVQEKVSIVCEGQSVYIPLATRHRLENPGKVPMILVEVQTGAYLGEDDIVRYEDLYSRD